MNPSMEVQTKQENPLYSILFNIILPVIILNQLTKRLGENGPTIALLAALALPIAYGTVDYIQRKNKNYISLLGIINILFTGGLALLHLEGIWFAIKEASFPLLIGIFVFCSAFTKKPFVQMMISNPGLMNYSVIEARLTEKSNQEAFRIHLRKSTYLLTLSFFISGLLNYILARRIFTDLDPKLTAIEKSTELNAQIAQMTWLSFIVIALPLMIFTIYIFWHLISGIKKLTGLKLEEIIPLKE